MTDIIDGRLHFNVLDREASKKKRSLIYKSASCDYREVFTAKEQPPHYIRNHTKRELNPWSVTTMSDRAYFNMLRKDLANAAKEGR